MVRAIDFAVRTSAGNVVRGAVSGDGGSEFLQIGSGESVSLNLPQSSVVAYERQGTDLILKLSDDRSITLSGYFESAAGEDNKLYLSSNGEVTEVFLTDGGDGAMYANYGPVDTWNKYSNVDDLRFTDDGTLLAAEGYADDEVGMGMFAPALLGLGGGGLGTAAAIAGGAAVIGGGIGGGGGGGGGSRTPPAVDNALDSKDISTNTPDKAVTVTGTGEPGEKVEVKVGDKTQTTTIKDDGTWETKFEGGNFPGDGKFEAEVNVTDKDGKTETLDGPEFVIDLTPPVVTATEGTVAAGDIENLAEYADGVTIKGEGESGATVSVVVNGHTQSTTIRDGKWEVTFTQSQIPAGDNTFPAIITATDPMGNKTVITESIRVDTIPHPLSFNTTAGDDTINLVESGGQVVVTGSSTAGAMVSVTMGGTLKEVKTGTDGKWEVRYDAGTFTADGTNVTLTARTVDAAGNPSETTQTLKIDTSTNVSFDTTPKLAGDGIINGDEAKSDVLITGKSEAGTKSVSVTWNNTTVPAEVSANGDWTVKFPSASIPASGTSTAIVNSVDAYGNAGRNERTITVDRETTVSIDANQAGGDNIIMSTEANAGVTITGRAEAGAKVEVSFQGKPAHTVYANDAGVWSSKFESSEITRGTFTNGPNTQVSVKSTDLAGNTDTKTHTIAIDTEVTNFDLTEMSTGDDGVLNNIEARSGLTVSGTVEVGAQSVMVTFGTFGTYPATVNPTAGTWRVTIPAGVIPAGETTVELTAVAKDKLGNISPPHTENVEIDRIVTPFTRGGSGLIGGDGTLNAVEVASGLDLAGTGEPKSTMVVRLPSGAFQEVHIDDSGTWSVRFEANQLPRGNNVSMRITFEATDKAGNFTSFDETVKIDTVAPDAPEVTDILKSTSGAKGLSGVFLDETIDTNFSFHRVGANGSDTPLNLKTGSLGSDFARFDNATVPEGDYLVINHHDAAGNDSATLLVTNNTGSISVDLNNAAFKNFDFTSLDLTLAPTNMTISAEKLIAMTGPDNTLMVKGGADDQITLQGGSLAADQGSSPSGYLLYHLGDNAASIYLDDDIKPNF
ncbi:Ig-like domain repeat protein [Pseudorhodobacter ferrugineus]|uniref:Ig-like domain repeat protein n=1 Tax=Pseudorhodobacter ferrugineus TaxID=77008 RepID=UPI0003B62851|nr:Ig-like domain repeat protein [Pseudorhodobacter ferrugineus]